MLIEFATTDILIAVIGGLTFLLAIVYFDRYLIRRHSSVVNAAYLTRIYLRRPTFDFRRMYRATSIKPPELILPAFEPKMLAASPALLLLTSGTA